MSKKAIIALVLFGGIILGVITAKLLPVGTQITASPSISSEERAALIKELKSFRENSQMIVKLVKLVRPSVVSITTKKVFMGYQDDFFWGMLRPQKYETSQIGSGVIVDNRGYIITNNHVIQGANEIRVSLDDDREFIGKVIGGDALSDIAVVKIDAPDLQPALLGDSDKIEVGEEVVAIGSPFGISQTVTSGIISAKRDSIGGAKITGDYPGFIQTDAAINPGNSGGPLALFSGEVIGINSVIISQSGGYQGIGFAIPINRAKFIMQQLIDKGKVSRPFLGVNLSTLNEALAKYYGFDTLDKLLKELKIDKALGVFVMRVEPQSPAFIARMREGDVILQYNGQDVSNHEELINLINKSKVDDKVDIKLVRNGKEMNIAVTIGERK